MYNYIENHTRSQNIRYYITLIFCISTSPIFHRRDFFKTNGRS